MSTIDWTTKFDPYEFEEFVAELWEDNRYTTDVRQGSGDRGIDVEATRGNKKELIQVKLYSPENKIGSGDVRKYATLYQQVPEANKVIIVTSSSFTSEAEKLANDLDVTLIDRDELAEMYFRSSLNSYRVSTNRGSSSTKKGSYATTDEDSDDVTAVEAVGAFFTLIASLITLIGALVSMILLLAFLYGLLTAL